MSALKLYGRFDNETNEARRWVMIPEASIWWVEYNDETRIKLHNRHTFVVVVNPYCENLSEDDKEAAIACDKSLARWCGENW